MPFLGAWSVGKGLLRTLGTGELPGEGNLRTPVISDRRPVGVPLEA
jgi:hypothetical protein